MYDRAVSRRVAYLLLVAAASVRLLIQAVAMPPYAGLDELYHVARLAFVLEEHRNPTTTERSIPLDLEATLERKWDAVPSFALLQADWHAPAIHDRPIASGPYAFGAEVTLADVCLVPQVANARRYQVPLDKFPRIVAVDAACQKLPAFEQARPDNQPDAE